ncbi:MAG: hypothetical protein IBJ11_05245 [Phycisphaerales bacterium]|nr:hypothetical protein [Phycisphaerales bacterium]
MSEVPGSEGAAAPAPAAPAVDGGERPSAIPSLIMAIVMAVALCAPAGIVAIIFSSMALSRIGQGHFADARRLISWSWTASMVGMIVWSAVALFLIASFYFRIGPLV